MGWDGVDGVVRVERVYQMALKSVYSRRTMGCLYLFISSYGVGNGHDQGAL